MKIIPQKTYKIVSTLSIDEIKNNLLVCFQEKEFNVTFNERNNSDSSLHTFCISKLYSYRLLNKPVIYGELNSQDQNKTEAHLTMKMGKVSKIFFMVWMILAGLAAIVCLPIVIGELINSESEIWTIIPIAIFVIGYYLVSAKFHRDSKELKGIIMKLVEGG